MRKTIREWSATRASTVGAAVSMAIADFRTVSPKIACPAIFAFPMRKDCWRTESVLIFCGYFPTTSALLRFNVCGRSSTATQSGAKLYPFRRATGTIALLAEHSVATQKRPSAVRCDKKLAPLRRANAKPEGGVRDH